VSSTSSKRFSLRFAVIACALAAGGCAVQEPLAGMPDVPALAGVPFFPQTEFDCGPAALATLLGASGLATTPEDLMPNVYTEGLEGSLQVELLAATRREGRLPIPIAPAPGALFELIAAGHPVLVLQNLRLRRAPLWHYAVVVGFDAERERVILRSGDERLKRERARRFAASWQLADNWGFVVARPGEVPVGVAVDDYMRAVVDAERSLVAADVEAAYAAAVQRWPGEPLVSFLAAGHAHGGARLDEAARLYRRTLALEPGHSAARNNLANLLLERDCLDAAEAEAGLALAQEPEAGPFRAAIVDTLAAIEAARAAWGGTGANGTCAGI
jgi:hypothetical protein